MRRILYLCSQIAFSHYTYSDIRTEYMIQKTENTSKSSRVTQQEDFWRIQDLAYLCLSHWKWFVVSIVIVMAAAYVYVRTLPDIFTRSAAILIKDDNSSRGGYSEGGALADLSLFRSNTSVNNELVAFKSPAIMCEVVKRLQLQTNYYYPGKFHDFVAYGNMKKAGNLPALVTFMGISDGDNASFHINIKPGGNVILSDFVQNGVALNTPSVEARLGQIVQTALRDSVNQKLKLMITPTLGYSAKTEYNLDVKRSSLYGAISQYSAKFSSSVYQEDTSILALSISDYSTLRAEDILRELVKVYNENWIEDKNQVAVSTAHFIEERLRVIEKDLGYVDDNISSYKSANLLPDVKAASTMYMSASSQTDADLMKLHNQMAMTRFVRDYLMEPGQKNQLLPANSGIDKLEAQVTEYNAQLLQRNNLVANSNENNPLVVELDRSLASMRSALIHSVDNQIAALNTQIKSLQKQEEQTNTQLAKNPSQAKYLLSVERQQKVKESLYLFLLQKYEENQLSQAFTAYNTRVLSEPYGSNAPTSPDRQKIMLIAFVISLVLPAALVILIEMGNTKVRGRKDVENLTIPFVGEVPYHYGRGQHRRKKYEFWKKTKEKNLIVVKEGSRNIVNEAFRVVRTNLEFMIDKEKNKNVSIITSFNPGSGKSFLSMNLAASFAIKGGKILVIDCDMRHGSASQYINSPKPGLSDYLSGKVKDVKDIVYTHEKYANWNIIPIGTIPPNPTELLFSSRLEDLMADMREKYDYIFIDCPPIELVADTQIVEKYADQTIFVVRAGLLERSMLPELENIYNKKKYKNMSMILNGTEGTKGRYSYKYGYKYGYHYGYGYGYHYGSDKSDKD